MTELEKTETTEDAVSTIKVFLQERKTKKSPSKADSEQFARLWAMVASERGLSTAMPLLCQGFSYCAAEPLFEHIKQNGKSAYEYSLIGTYACVRDSKNEIELRIYLSLLACELAAPTSAEAIDTLMKRIVAASYNKEGKVSGNYSVYVKRLLVAPVVGRRVAEGVQSNLTPAETRPFLKLVGEAIKGILESESATAKEKVAAEELAAWMGSLIKGEALEMDKSLQEDAGGSDNKAPGGKATGSAAQTTIEIDQVLAFIRAQQKKIDTLHDSVSCLESECARVRDEKNKLSSQIEQLEETLERSRENVRVLKAQLDKSTEKIGQLKDELHAAKEYASVLNLSSAKESDETITRIASELKVEYRDYQDALDLEMDADLGENMRDQLGNVFEILKKHGLKL